MAGIDGQNVPDADPPPMVGWITRFTSTNVALWSGETALDFDGVVYQPGAFVQIEHAVSELGAPSRRLRASFAVTDPGLRAALLQDEGPVPIEGHLIASTDRGQTWARIGNPFAGRLSNASIEDGVYSCEFETAKGDVDRGRPIRWSHERQVKRGSGGDLAFEMSGQLEAGVEIRWPR
ncbi:MAG: hypothetical protein OXF51_05780 [Alphaproteobacteria bacterium]|nr:hypothetical protein [Alphaproteobacteria bacterium]